MGGLIGAVGGTVGGFDGAVGVSGVGFRDGFGGGGVDSRLRNDEIVAGVPIKLFHD